MNTTYEASEAKTHLPRILEGVRRGDKVTITKHGKPIAQIVPYELEVRDEQGKILDAIHALAATVAPWGILTPRDPIEEGRHD